MTTHSIKVYKQYFNFAVAHFLIFADGSREPLHGHNYRLECRGEAETLSQDLVFDFLDIKPIIRSLCDALDHRLLLPTDNPYLKTHNQGDFVHLTIKDKLEFVLPHKDVLFLPINNTSAERLAMYFARQIDEKIYQKYQFRFKNLEVTIEETPGQCASFQRCD